MYSAQKMPDPADDIHPPKSLSELFFGFLSIGARSFGGVMPWAHRVMVEERRWLTPAEFVETMGLCQFLPGPNVGNSAIVLGKRWFGLRGALAAFLGLFALPFVWVMALGLVYAQYASVPMVRSVVIGVGAAGAGFFLATAIKLGRPLIRSAGALAVVAGCFLGVAVFRVSLLYVLPVAVAVAMLLSHRRLL